jgi:hypothetical protein
MSAGRDHPTGEAPTPNNPPLADDNESSRVCLVSWGVFGKIFLEWVLAMRNIDWIIPFSLPLLISALRAKPRNALSLAGLNQAEFSYYPIGSDWQYTKEREDAARPAVWGI